MKIFETIEDRLEKLTKIAVSNGYTWHIKCNKPKDSTKCIYQMLMYKGNALQNIGVKKDSLSQALDLSIDLLKKEVKKDEKKGDN